MSEISNPLNDFRTYSYYFILGVASSTAMAEKVAAGTGEVTYTKFFTHATGDKYKIRTEGGEHWALMINGATDTQLIVKSLRFQSMLNPDTQYKGQNLLHTMNLEGEIVIQEPFGIKFYNIIQQIACEMNVDATGLVFFIKPIFVGYPSSGAGSQAITDVKPYIFVITDITSIIDEGGATYSLQTFGVVNGASKLPQFQSVSSGFTLNIPQNSTLETAFSVLGNELNSYFNTRKSTVIDQAKKIGLGYDYGRQRPIEIQFHLDEDYKKDDLIVGTNTKLNYQESTGQGAYYIAKGPSSGIEELIDIIMTSCKGIIDDRGSEDENGAVGGFIYKILTVVESDKEKFTVHYHIQKYKIVFETIENPGAFKPDTFLEFDYIFTGQNVDIRNFDIKMQSGFAFFQTVASSDTLFTRDEIVNETDNQYGATSPKSTQVLRCSGGTPAGSAPVAPGDQTTDSVVRNKKYPASTSSYFTALKRWSSEFESIGVKIEIKGNPDLMGETTFIPKDFTNDEIANKHTYTESGAHKSPLYLKINIKFPTDYTNPRTNFESFWFDGYYYVMTVNNIFEDGDFFQELTLYNVPSDIYGDTVASEEGSIGNQSGAAASTSATETTKSVDEIASGLQSSVVSTENEYGKKLGSALLRDKDAAPIETPITIEIVKDRGISLSDFGKFTSSDAIKTVKNISGKSVGEISSGIKDAAVSEAKNLATQAASKVTGKISGKIDEVTGQLKSAVGEVSSVLQSIDDITDEINAISGQVTGALGSAGDIKEKIESLSKISISDGSLIKTINDKTKQLKALDTANLSPDNLKNLVSGEAPVLSKDWLTMMEKLGIK